MRVVPFDGIVGLTHSYAGLSAGNLAAQRHAGELGNPKAAALQGIGKMRAVAALGVVQGVLPPQPRPDLDALRRVGFTGSDAAILDRAAKLDDGRLLRLVSSASSMWAANAATVAPSCDTADGRVHFTPANLSSMFHRSLEAPLTTRILRAIFADPADFIVHEPLPAGEHFADEGAANHLRLATRQAAVHVFAWGRSAFGDGLRPSRHPARQTREASQALARLHVLDRAPSIFPQQDPIGIDAGAFHTDVLAVGHQNFLMLHEHAFVESERLIGELRNLLGPELVVCLAREAELPLSDAVKAYPFNSEIVSLPSGRMAIVAPSEAEQTPAAHRFLDRVVAEPTPIDSLVFVDVNASMKNGGGPACLRLAVPLTEAELGALRGRVLLDDALADELETWVIRHYRERLTLDDLRDPTLVEENRVALDELTTILALGSIYDFQQSG